MLIMTLNLKRILKIIATDLLSLDTQTNIFFKEWTKVYKGKYVYFNLILRNEKDLLL